MTQVHTQYFFETINAMNLDLDIDPVAFLYLIQKLQLLIS